MGKSMELITNQKLFTKNGLETKWTYLNDVEIRKYGNTYRRIILVKCECGNIKEIQLNNVRGGHSVSCGQASCRIPHNKHRRNVETSYNSLLYNYKKGAESRGHTFELTNEEFKFFISGNCYYCKSEPSNLYQIKDNKTGLIRAGVPIYYNGIDRVDNSLGYTIDNCVTCCDTCNKMKTNYDLDFFYKHIEKIYNNFKNNLDK